MNGYYIDPAIVPSTVRERHLLAEIRKRGLSLHRVHAQGASVRLTGPGVCVFASSLGTLHPEDLEIADPATVAAVQRSLAQREERQQQRRRT